LRRIDPGFEHEHEHEHEYEGMSHDGCRTMGVA
jgi:hypothetical protein